MAGTGSMEEFDSAFFVAKLPIESYLTALAGMGEAHSRLTIGNGAHHQPSGANA